MDQKKDKSMKIVVWICIIITFLNYEREILSKNIKKTKLKLQI